MHSKTNDGGEARQRGVGFASPKGMDLTHASELTADWSHARARAGRMLVALDFDGTLAPIVSRPEDATMLLASRDPLRRLASRPDTDVAIVSGRGLADARERVGLADLYYAGNHGLEIEGPGVSRVNETALAARPRLEQRIAEVRSRFADVDGLEVEDKVLSASVHFRRVSDPAQRDEIARAVHRLCDGDPLLRTVDGKMIVEIRPAVEWDKGHATRFLLETLRGDGDAELPTLFVGDDVTDEDAFRVVRDHGSGVLVAPEPRETLASAWLRSPEEVAELLSALADSE